MSCRFQLPIGHYLIVPTTFAPDEEAEFLIRIFSEKQNFIEYVYLLFTPDHIFILIIPIR